MKDKFLIDKNLKNKLKKATSSFIYKRNKNQIEKIAKQIKDEMLQDFLNHPVTKELIEKNTAQNYSSTLVGYGNLYSFIGFNYPEDPIAPILEKINQINFSVRQNGADIFLYIKYPTPEDIWQITPMPWAEGRSWAKGIESGISGLNFYLTRSKAGPSKFSMFEDSRSGNAIQSSKKIVPYARYNPTQYITSFLKKYKTKFSSIGKKSKNIFTEISNSEE
jgi:hypothetical protein